MRKKFGFSGKRKTATESGSSTTTSSINTPTTSKDDGLELVRVVGGSTKTDKLDLSAQNIDAQVLMAQACLTADHAAREHGLRRLVHLSRIVSDKTKLSEAIPSIVPLLKSAFPVIQMFAAFALAQLAENDVNQAAVRDLGAIPLLVPLLSSNNLEIIEKVLWLFTNLSRDPNSRRLIVGEGAMRHIVELLTSRKRSENIVHGCCKLLRNLFHEIEHQEEFVQADGISALMNLPVLTTEFPSLPLDWTMLTSILCYYRPSIRRAVLIAGAGSSLVSLLSSSNEDVRNYATQALTNLSYDEANVEGIMNSGAGRPLVDLYESASAPLKQHILTVLCNLAISNDDIVHVLLEEEKIISCVVAILSNPNESPTNRFRATNLVAALARVEHARRVLLELGALPKCEEIAHAKGDERFFNAGVMAIHNLKIPFSLKFQESRGTAAAVKPKATQMLDKKTKHRMRVVNEILETEKNYVSNLLVVIKVYDEPLSQIPPKKHKHMVDVDERKAMFKMFDYLYRAHQDFLQSLNKRVIEQHKDPNYPLGPAFLELATVLKSYRVFINNYDTASTTLSNALKRPQFSDWVQNQQDSFKTKSLSSLLIEPIQRIPRYLLLLSEILRAMEESHPDHKDLTNALSQIGEAADWLEGEKDKAVHKSKLIELQGRIKNLAKFGITDLTDSISRKFVHEGPLLLEAGKSKASEYVHFFLLNDLLLVAVQKKNTFILKHKLLLSEIVVSNVANEPDEGDERNAFQVLAKHTDLIVSTTKADEKAEWLEAFRQVIAEASGVASSSKSSC